MPTLFSKHSLGPTYTSDDLAPFARDLGHHSTPFPWDQEARRHLRARLDALYFHLYGLDRDDDAHIIYTFPSSNTKTKPNSSTTAPKPLSSPT